LITSGRPAGRGASGAVTALGTVGGLAGAATIAAMGAAVGQPNPAIVAGATVQGIYLCEACEVETEQPIHRCGRGAALTRGKRWVTNDLVNLAGAGVGAAAGAVSALMCA
jgi:uncharacterized membrane protein